MTAPRPGRDPRDELPDHLPALRAFAISLTRDVTAADDLVQDTIVKAWTNIERFEAGTNLRAWLFAILRNTFYSDRRKRRELADPDGLHAATLVDQPAHDGRLALTDFKRAFDLLSPEHREVLLIIGALGFSYEEAADIMKVRIGTVKSRVNRARARIGDILGLKSGENILVEPDNVTLGVVGRARTRAA